MKQYILPSLKLSLVCIIICSAIYPLLIAAIGRLSPGKGNGEKLFLNGKVVGYESIGQKFTKDKYFWSRPSAVDYNASASAGSNKGPSNPAYLKDISSKIDDFIKHNPGVSKKDIPAELVTYSGSGLDPDLSPTAAMIQIPRIASVRGIPGSQLRDLVNQQIQKPLLGIFGPAKVNVLKLNIALDQLSCILKSHTKSNQTKLLN